MERQAMWADRLVLKKVFYQEIKEPMIFRNFLVTKWNSVGVWQSGLNNLGAFDAYQMQPPSEQLGNAKKF